MDFDGAKAAIFIGDKLLVFLRDNKPGLRFANMWDFPGGGREGEETPFECIQREVREEFGLNISLSEVLSMKVFPAMHNNKLNACFFVINLPATAETLVKFGSEGQKWRLMAPREFIDREDAVPPLRERLKAYLKE